MNPEQIPDGTNGTGDTDGYGEYIVERNGKPIVKVVEDDDATITIERPSVSTPDVPPVIEEGHVVLTGEDAKAHLEEHHPEVLQLFHECAAAEGLGALVREATENVLADGVSGAVVAELPETADTTRHEAAEEFQPTSTQPGAHAFAPLPGEEFVPGEDKLMGWSAEQVRHYRQLLASIEDAGSEDRKRIVATLGAAEKEMLLRYCSATRAQIAQWA